MIQPDATGGSSGVIAANERIQDAVFEDLHFLGSNQFNPLMLYMGVDCLRCSAKNISGVASQGAALTYETVMIGTNTWYDGALPDEGEGFNENSRLENISCGGNPGGYVACYQGRLSNASLSNALCGLGVHGGQPNSQCFAIFNSASTTLSDIVNEGQGDNPQILLENSSSIIGHNIGLGTPNPPAGIPAGNGLSFANVSNSTFDGHLAGQFTSFASLGALAVSVDAQSHNNKFLNWQSNGATDVNFADLTTNFMQWCDVGTNQCRNGSYSTLGYLPGYQMLGTGPQPKCNANTQTAHWPVRIGGHEQVCKLDPSGILSWQQVF
jgi:hypothetical protein